MTHFENLISKQTVEELMEYINDFERYSPWALTAVINELKAKGKTFSDEELNSLYEKIEKKKEAEEEQSPFFSSSKSWGKYIVTDPEAPLLYSKFAVSSFSFFFSAIFGAILLALNVENKTNKIKVIGVGVLFTTIVILVGSLSSLPILYVFGINGASSYLLSTEFWNKYIGRETKYRAKSTWRPLLVLIAIAVVLFGWIF